MSKKKKIIITICGVVFLISAWYMYQITTAQPENRALRDICSIDSVIRRNGESHPSCYLKAFSAEKAQEIKLNCTEKERNRINFKCAVAIIDRGESKSWIRDDEKAESLKHLDTDKMRFHIK